MCRITGFRDFGVVQYEMGDIICDMRDTMIHGGPDDAGVYVEADKGVAFGHRRLSILDLSYAGHQPMEFDGLVIVHNGEIYNFMEIRKELETIGYRFSSNSDTEVILKAFHKWGFGCVRRFRGMWAFAIWDRKTQTLILSRDRVGVKPLYWYYKDGLFMFASELKAFFKHPSFRKELSLEGLALYLQHGYITSPHTIFEHTYKLVPGCFLVLDKSGNAKLKRYWDVKDYFLRGEEEKDKWFKRSEGDVIEELEEILTESFKLRMVSDVPVGIFLSGGIDSSLVTALLQKEYSVPLKTFTIGFYEEAYNEAKWAKKVSEHLGTEHTELYCTPDEAFEVIPKLPELYDEPFGDSSAIPTFLVSRLAKAKVKVSLSADGGDEQFFGYNRYVLTKKIDRLKVLLSIAIKFISPEFAFALYDKFGRSFFHIEDFASRYRKLRRLYEYKNFMEKYNYMIKMLDIGDVKNLGVDSNLDALFKLHKCDGFGNELKMMIYDILTYLPDDILVKVDRATMGVALEGRDPFLDNRIVEYSSQVPLHLKYRNGRGKYLLRRILCKYIPKELVDRPKQGFAVPVQEWFRGKLKGLYLEYLSRERISRQNLLNAEVVSDMLQKYLAGKARNYAALWNLFVFELWSERWGL